MARPPGQRRQPILDSALEAFVESGFQGASIPRIAKGAGISPATCYLYFDSKEALANCVFREALAKLDGYTAAGLDGVPPSQDLFMQLWRGLLHFGRSHLREYLFLSQAMYADYLDAESRMLLKQSGAREERSMERYRAAGLIGDIGLVEIRALVRGHARVLIEYAAAGQHKLTDELIERTGLITWAALQATLELRPRA